MRPSTEAGADERATQDVKSCPLRCRQDVQWQRTMSVSTRERVTVCWMEPQRQEMVALLRALVDILLSVNQVGRMSVEVLGRELLSSCRMMLRYASNIVGWSIV